jgi:HD-GYP domain-containing protein (c-di-GMP phosphodiesterase class II)
MQTPDLWLRTLTRILAAVVVLGSILAGLSYWVASQREYGTVNRLAQQEALSFVNSRMDGGLTKPDAAEFESTVRNVIQDRFPIVALYDQDRNKSLEVNTEGKEWADLARHPRQLNFPTDNQPVSQRIKMNGNTFIQVLIPLSPGYFEGLYELDPQTVAGINQELLRIALTVFFSVIATGMLLFPLIKRLNRELVRTSGAILVGNVELMEVLGSAIAKRDSDTNAHNYRVTLYAIELAYAVNLPREMMRTLIAGSFLHDVGKIGIPDAILLKPGKLNKSEFAVMKTHVDLGGNILDKSSWLSAARDVVLNHHEKYDGSGYPKGIKGNDIPLTARIFAIVDVFDALTSKRPYKEPMSLEQSLAILRNDSGNHFDPELIEVFSKIVPGLYLNLQDMPDEMVENLLRDEAARYYGIR